MPYQYPTSDTAEIPYWVLFEAADYSVLAAERTRNAISARAFDYIQLPLPLGIDIMTEHKYTEGPNPVGPILSAAGEANAGSSAALLKRALVDPILAIAETMNTTSTQKMFSNITEMSLVSEARRVFKLSYLFVPKNFDDSAIIANICEGFRTASYPSATEVPERVLPAPLWRLQVIGAGNSAYLTKAWFADPLICVLNSVSINKIPFGQEETARFFQDGSPMATSLVLFFQEFETGTYLNGQVLSKSEVSVLNQGGSI
jgi:hypothetical protein